MKKLVVVLAVAGTSLVLAVAVGMVASRLMRVPPAEVQEPVDRLPSKIEIAESIFDGKLGPGWQDWGWGPHEMTGNGPAKIGFGGYGGLVLHRDDLTEPYGALVFRVKAPESFGNFLSVQLMHRSGSDGTFPRLRVEKSHGLTLPDGFREVLIPWEDLNPKGHPVDRIMFSAVSNVSGDWVLLDKIGLTKPGSGAPAGKVAQAKMEPVRLTVSCGREAKPISPLVYGFSHGAFATGGTAFRIGGNPITRLNWDLLSAWNSGSDWFFENTFGGDGIWKWIDGGLEHQVSMAVQLPMIGWVSKDGTSVGFPVSKLGPQRNHDPYKPEAGDGYKPDGTPIRPPHPSQTSVEATPEVVARWLRTLREKDQARGRRSVQIYILDNEPTLWDVTHRDVHPDPLTYDELLDRTIRYGTAVRDAEPEALIAGPAEWGWSGYFYSAKDRAEGFSMRPDRRAHDDMPLVAWYLKKLAEHEKTTGKRILDILDVHFYPAADGLVGGNARKDPEGAALRLRATRALWDPDYRDESWIKDNIRLIPRLEEWIAQNYPGRKIMLGEWSFGGDDHISGALATAESLGRFGQHGVYAAFYWAGPSEDSTAFWAFRAFRNYDGKGAKFQDLSLPTREAGRVSLFASRDAARSRVVAIALNLDPAMTKDALIDLEGCGAVKPNRVFTYAAGSKGLTEERPGPGNEKQVRETLPPYSIKVIELVDPALAPPPAPSPSASAPAPSTSAPPAVVPSASAR